MSQLGVYPLQCEFDAITAAAVQVCDGLDGLSYGIIAAPEECHFNPHTLVGKSFNCSGVMKNYSSDAAMIVQAAWRGPQTTNGSFLWYGLNPGASFSGLLNTTCDAKSCMGVPFSITEDWIRMFIEQDPAFNDTEISFSKYDTIFHQSNQQYASIIGTDDPDLSSFRDAGGKIITWHGLADQLIFPNGTVNYYNKVMAADPKAQDYYRFFEAPGVAHCGGGIGPVPVQALESLVGWVEKGAVPATLTGVSAPDANGTVRLQPLCAYPLVSAYQGGDPAQASSYECMESFQ
jgi:hypothetical protein